MRTDGVYSNLNFNGDFKGYGDKVGIIYIGREKPYFGRFLKSSRSWRLPLIILFRHWKGLAYSQKLASLVSSPDPHLGHAFGILFDRCLNMAPGGVRQKSFADWLFTTIDHLHLGQMALMYVEFFEGASLGIHSILEYIRKTNFAWYYHTMKMKFSKLLRIFGFRILIAIIVFILLGLLCDHWFYKHMTKKWTLLEQHKENFRKDYGNGREFSVMDIKALWWAGYCHNRLHDIYGI